MRALDLVTVEYGWSGGVGVDSVVLESKQIGIFVAELLRVMVLVVTGVRMLQILLDGLVPAVVVVCVCRMYFLLVGS